MRLLTRLNIDFILLLEILIFFFQKIRLDRTTVSQGSGPRHCRRIFRSSSKIKREEADSVVLASLVVVSAVVGNNPIPFDRWNIKRAVYRPPVGI